MNFAHIFRDGTFACALLGPLAQYLPTSIAMVLTTMMWTLIPATATLQLLGMSSLQWSPWRRLAVAFIFPIVCAIDVGAFTPQFLPTSEFAAILKDILRDLYGVDDTSRAIVVGSTVVHTAINNGRSLTTLLFYLVLTPYILSYVFFTILAYL
ncbi:hypothetical protein PFISCL1PPCAC_14425, partial [Pristionchus fissidentatus]